MTSETYTTEPFSPKCPACGHKLHVGARVVTNDYLVWCMGPSCPMRHYDTYGDTEKEAVEKLRDAWLIQQNKAETEQ